MPEPIFMKLDMYYIIASELISTAFFINPCHQSIYPSIVARQLPDKNVTATTKTKATIELFDASFSLWSLSYQRKVGD
jgi:hypothetical protein